VTNGQLKVVKCGVATCTSGNTTTPVDTGGVGQFTSITLGTDGLPVISYYDQTLFDLKIAKCGNAACSAGNTITAVDQTGDVGAATSITLGVDGLPVVAYYDTTNTRLKLARCTTASCTTVVATPVDASANVGSNLSLALSADGLPVIAYYDATNGDLKVAKCGTAGCTGTPSITTVDSSGIVGLWPSVTLGADGLPVISYYVGNLKVAKCSSPTCAPYVRRR